VQTANLVAEAVVVGSEGANNLVPYTETTLRIQDVFKGDSALVDKDVRILQLGRILDGGLQKAGKDDFVPLQPGDRVFVSLRRYFDAYKIMANGGIAWADGDSVHAFPPALGERSVRGDEAARLQALHPAGIPLQEFRTTMRGACAGQVADLKAAAPNMVVLKVVSVERSADRTAIAYVPVRAMKGSLPVDPDRTFVLPSAPERFGFDIPTNGQRVAVFLDEEGKIAPVHPQFYVVEKDGSITYQAVKKGGE
jgi:hypothetical protein